MVKCQEIKDDLALFADGFFESEDRERIESHLAQCPLCRQRLSEYRSLGRELRGMAAVNVPAALSANISAAIAAQTAPNGSPRFGLIEPKRRWTDTWMLPSAIGSLASVVIGVSMLWSILHGPNSVPELSPVASSDSYAARTLREPVPLTPLEYASTRREFSNESPSVNPQGALVALTRSLVRGEMEDEEVVVVADVFGNGLARIAEVVESPQHDRHAIEELQKALQSDPEFAPFVPARFDQRQDPVRVILKIQNVNVSTEPENSGL